jgi:hypothetical protein
MILFSSFSARGNLLTDLEEERYSKDNKKTIKTGTYEMTARFCKLFFFFMNVVILTSFYWVGRTACRQDEIPGEQPLSMKRKKVPSAVAAYYEDSSSEDDGRPGSGLGPDGTPQAVVGPHEEREWAEIFEDIHEDIRTIRQRIGGPGLAEEGFVEHMEDLYALMGVREGQTTICDILETLLTYMNCHLEKAEEGKGGNLLLRLPLLGNEGGVTRVDTIDQMIGLLRRAEVLSSAAYREIGLAPPQVQRERSIQAREVQPSLLHRLLGFFFGRVY